MDEENSSSFTEAINRVVAGLNVEADTREKIAKELKHELTESARRESFAKLTAEQQKKRTKELISHIQLQTDKLKNNRITLDEFNDATQSSTRDLAQLRKTADAGTKAQIQQTLGAVKDLEVRQKVNDQLRTSSGALVGTMIRSASTLTAGMIKAVQDGGNGIRVASSIIQAELTAGGQVAGAASKGIASVGSAMSGMGGSMGKAGKAVEFLGTAAGMAAEAVIAFEKFKFDLLSKQAEIVVTSFQDISSTGATFSEGMSALKNASVESGLATQTLGKIQKAAADDIAGAGLGAAKGFKLMAKTFSGPTGDQMKSSLLNLGFSFEEQGAVVAKTMEQMRRAGRDMSTVSASDIAQSTESYAKNLRTIAAVTGQDAKAKMAEAKKASLNAAVRSKLLQAERGGDKNATERFTQQYSMAAAKGLGDAFLQKFATSDSQGRGGVVTDAASNVLMVNAEGSNEELNKMTEASKNASLGMDEFNRQAAASAGKLAEIFSSEKTAKAMEPIGIAGAVGVTGFVKTMSEKFIEVLDSSLKGTQNSKEAVAATQAVQDGMKTLDATTRGLNATLLQGEQLRSELEGQLFSHLKDYSELMVTALGHAKKILDFDPLNIDNSVMGFLKENAIAIGALLTSLIAPLVGLFSGLAANAGAASAALGSTAAAATAAAAPAAAPVASTAAATAATAGLAVAPLAVMGAATVAADTAKMGGSNLNPFSATGNAGLGMSKFFESIFGSRGDEAERKQKKRQAESGATWSLKEAEDIKKRLGIDVPVTPVTAANAKIALVEVDKKEATTKGADDVATKYDAVAQAKELEAKLSPETNKALQDAVILTNKEVADAVSKLPATPAQDVNVSVGLSPKDISALQNAASGTKELTVGLSPKDISALQNAAKIKEVVPPKEPTVELSPADSAAIIKNKEVNSDNSISQLKAGLEYTNATLQLNDTVQRLAAYLEKNDKTNNTEDKPVKPAFNPADMFALVSKINELMQAQVDKTDEYLDLTREMLGVASDHKNISTKMYRAG